MARIFIGVDVSKEWLDAAVRDGATTPRRFANDPDGIDQLVAWARDNGEKFVCCLAAYRSGLELMVAI